MKSSRHSAKKLALRLRLYVAGQSPNSVAAMLNLRALLAGYPPQTAELQIIDVLLHPELGARAGVLATPMLIKLAPPPERRIVGNLKNTEALVAVLGLTEVTRE